VNTIARAASATLSVALLGASPSYAPAPHDARTGLVQKYIDALRARRYNDAYALLSGGERAYFGDGASYRSVYDADRIALRSARVLGARCTNEGCVYFVRERISYVDHANDVSRTLEATVPIGVLSERGALRIKDPGKPYRAFATNATTEVSGLRVTVKKAEFFPDRIALTVTFTNLGDRFVTLLPYGKSVLRDDRGGLYRIIAIKDWSVTDKQLFEGVPLAPNARYTGALAFTAQRITNRKLRWALTIAPALREDADLPFDLTVDFAAPSPRSIAASS
jgi:hypothetical protein